MNLLLFSIVRKSDAKEKIVENEFEIENNFNNQNKSITWSSSDIENSVTLHLMGE
jgi:hypothetical protein